MTETSRHSKTASTRSNGSVHLHVLLAAAASLSAGGAAWVPSAAAQDNTLPPDIVVSASRIPVPGAEVGSAVSVITAQELENRQTTLVSDILRDVPGVAVSRAGPPGTLTQVRIRGAEANHTLVLIDGIEVNDPAIGGEFNFANLTAADIERIEVLRGAQSSLYGSDAIGGVISITTKRGKKGFDLSSFLEGGSFGTVYGGGRVLGGGDKYRFSLGGNYYGTSGINITRSSVPANINEKDGFRNSTVSGNVQVTPFKALTLSFFGRYVNGRTETDPQDFTFGSSTQGFVIDGLRTTLVEQYYGKAQADLSLLNDKWKHKVFLTVADTDNDFLTEGDPTSGLQARKLRVAYQTSYAFSTPRIANADHKVIFAYEHENERFKNETFPRSSTANRTETRKLNGYVFEHRLGLWKRLFASGSVRYDDNDQFKNAATYRATGAYVHKETGTRVHGSYGTGVTNPTFFEQFGFDPATFIGNPGLKPEKSKGWDIGVEQKLFGGKLVVDVTYFQARLTDEIITVFDPTTFVATVENQAGTSKRRGIEVTLKAKVTENLFVAAAYTYTRAKDPDGSVEVRRPKHIASASATYQFLGGRGKVNLTVRFNGSQQDNEFIFATPETRVRLKSYTLVNLGASYRVTDNLEVYARVENMLNQRYEEVFSQSSPRIGVFGGVRLKLDLTGASPLLS